MNGFEEKEEEEEDEEEEDEKGMSDKIFFLLKNKNLKNKKNPVARCVCDV